MRNFRSVINEYASSVNGRERAARDPLGGFIRVREPIAPRASYEWEELQDPPRLEKTISFEERGQILIFIEFLMEYEDQIDHHSSITIEGNDVTVSVTTHDAGAITAIDKQFAAQVDMIRDDAISGWDPDNLIPSETLDTIDDLHDKMSVGYTDESTAYEGF